MKNRFTTVDIVYMIQELKEKLVGLRVDQIYDIDKKTYLIRLIKSGVKKVLLLESGARFHTTQFDWPKNPAPSGFSMKLRKHLNNKRLEKIEQVGCDRIVHLQFGMDTAAYHLFLELYDKGNIVLTDHTMTILNLVRPRIVGEERMAAHERYPVNTAQQSFALDRIQTEAILRGKPTGNFKEIFLSKLEFGPTLFSYVLESVGLHSSSKIGPFIDTEENITSTLNKLVTAFEKGTRMLTHIENCSGIIVLTKPTTRQTTDKNEQLILYDQFHPAFLVECFDEHVLNFDSFDETVDEFFSKVESQKLDVKQLNQEKEAIKKLERVKMDQNRRLKELKDGQETDKKRAELISMNQASVDLAISTIRKLVASQIAWDVIEDQLKEARSLNDPLASMISRLNLKQNKFTVTLTNPYDDQEKPQSIDLDLNLSAFANASKYFDLKKASARKEERTKESQGKALKSTEKKTMATLKEAATIHSIKKARKVLWFEKFRWFISSENYLIIGGRDAQQNELLVKRYLRPRDVYMHADAHGAPTLIIKNDRPNEDISPKSLNESGVFAVSSSGSWESKVIPSSWWVWGDQVSKSAPTGEYLPTGSFMIRGKKNYLPSYQLVLGFGLMFRLTEESVEAHLNERARKIAGDGDESSSHTVEQEDEDEEEIEQEHAGEEGFPDTHINLNMEGNKVQTRLASTKEDDEESSEYIVTSAAPLASTMSVQKQKNKQKKIAKNTKNQPNKSNNKSSIVETLKEAPSTSLPVNESGINPKKRGQHGRKKKLREKYKFQDDEERELKMKLLRVGKQFTLHDPESSATTKSEAFGFSNDDDTSNIAEIPVDGDQQEVEQTELKIETQTPEILKEPSENLQEEETEEPREGETELDLLKMLTGSPLESDELLYSIPVVAPYSTLQNYKFRVKMIPGNTKRGKAARICLEHFLRVKDATEREKDLIKAVKDQDFARNFPGKVKLSNIIREKK